MHLGEIQWNLVKLDQVNLFLLVSGALLNWTLQFFIQVCINAYQYYNWMESWFFWELFLFPTESLLYPHKICLTKEKKNLFVMVISALLLCFARKQNQDRCLVYLYNFKSSTNSFVREIDSEVLPQCASMPYRYTVMSFLIILS